MVIPDQADVVVVGGGPAGSSTATHLARAGLHVVVLDKAAFPREKACAEYCSPGIVDALDDLGVLDRIVEREHRTLGQMRVVANGRDLSLDFASDRPEGHSGLGIRRSVLDAELLSFAGECGAEVHQQVRVTGPILEDGVVVGVNVRTAGGTGAIRAGFVVGADGLHSSIARSLRLDRPPRWPNRLGLVARYRGLRTSMSIGQMHIGDGVYSGVTPVGGREALISLVVPMGAKPSGVKTAEFYEETLRQLAGIEELLAGAERVSSVRGLGPLGKRVHARSGGGFLLVGDAAGFFDPLTGEGIHRAVRGGGLAAQATLDALGRADRLPVGYESARSRLFTEKERVCWIIQALTAAPRLLDYTVLRAGSRDRVNQVLCGVLGDYAPAGGAFQPSFLWSLFKP